MAGSLVRAGREKRGLERRLEDGFHAHLTLITALLLALGFLVRLWAAWGTFLNPDEALHFLAANRPSLMAAYYASLPTAHPPLLILVLQLWRVLGTSELVLRLPSVIAGTVFCWFSFQWMTRLLGPMVGWIGLLFVTFLPPLIQLSSEVRQYALLLCFLAGAAFFLEEGLAKNSAARMLLSAVFLQLGMLTHYSALFFAAAMAAYSFFRLLSHRFSRRVFAAWAAGQAAALALFVFLYKTHISALKGSRVEQQTMQGWLRISYFHWGHDQLPLFIFARSFGVLQFVFGQLAVGDVAGLMFLVGVVFLLRAKAMPRFRTTETQVGLVAIGSESRAERASASNRNAG